VGIAGATDRRAADPTRQINRVTLDADAGKKDNFGAPFPVGPDPPRSFFGRLERQYRTHIDPPRPLAAISVRA
jgi:hypothetical protein